MDSFGPTTWHRFSPTTYSGHVACDNAAHSNRTIQPCPMWHHFALVTWCGPLGATTLYSRLSDQPHNTNPMRPRGKTTRRRTSSRSLHDLGNTRTKRLWSVTSPRHDDLASKVQALLSRVIKPWQVGFLLPL